MTRLTYGAALCLALVASAALAAPPTLDIPAEIKADPGDWVVVSPKTNAKAITYVGLDGLKAFPSSELKDAKKLVVNPPKAGRYRFVAVGTLGDEQTAAPFVLVVGEPAPGPDDPPAPTPDDDRTAFAAAVKAAYRAEASPTKAKDTLALASVYRAASRTTVRDATVTTNAMLFADMTTASRALLPATAIPGVRSVIGERLTGTTAKPGLLRFPSDPINRDAAAAEFLAIATALEGATK